jgi:hypothetical protein
MEAQEQMPGESKCRKHNADFEFYCTKCKELICKKCITDHSKNNDPCLYLEDYGKEYLLTAFDEIAADLKRNSDQINLSPVESKRAAGELVDSLRALKAQLQEQTTAVSKQITRLERLKTSSFLLPSVDEVLRIVEVCKKSLQEEVKDSRGIARAIEIIQSTKDFMANLANNAQNLMRAKERIDKLKEELTLGDVLQATSALYDQILQVGSNRLVAYTARVGMPIATRCIYGIKEQTNNLMAYDIDTKAMRQIEFPIALPIEPTLTQIEDKLFITGGGNYLTTNIEYIEATTQATQKAAMTIGKKWHATVVTAPKMFMAIGGYNNEQKHLAACEAYNLNSDSWEEMPSLTEPKQSVAACLFENKEVIVFGGYSGKRHNTIESFVIAPRADAWVVIELENKAELPIFSCGAASQISRSEILLLRGNSTKDTFVFSRNERVIRKADALRKADSFLLQTLYPVKDRLAVMGYYATMHIFDVRSQSWDEVEYVLA